MDFMQLMQMLGLGGGGNAALGGVGGGGSVGGGTTPGFGGGGGVPYGTPSAGVPTAGIPASPEDVTPMSVPPPPTPGLRMPTMADARSVFSRSPPQPDPMMSPTAGVPYPQVPTPTSLGEALQPAGPPAPPPPMPMARPPGLGGGGGGGSPGYFGGSPATNPNLKPIGSPAAPAGPADIGKMLQGIKQPQGPDVVKPSTPAAHQTKAVGNSELLQLLQALMPGTSRGMRMPTTLGQALELKPSSWGGIYG